jgi:hypothetical protein
MTFYPSLIPDPGVKKAPDPASSRIRIRSTAFEYIIYIWDRIGSATHFINSLAIGRLFNHTFTKPGWDSDSLLIFSLF